ncbi:unnamed protein product [Amoebophrya sp. A25]|nr:unnamed protein product [Amoebophrya sp. A25]|eukprot:GSA25T00022876001.1
MESFLHLRTVEAFLGWALWSIRQFDEIVMLTTTNEIDRGFHSRSHFGSRPCAASVIIHNRETQPFEFYRTWLSTKSSWQVSCNHQ